jgi:molybdenum cofactor synthesis domain-containing protein
VIVRAGGDEDIAERVDFDRARELMLGAAQPLPSETLALDDAHDRVVAAVLRASADIVPYARSAMDGFALRAADTFGADKTSVILPVVGMTYAGNAPRQLAPGTAMAIATGAPLPAGADAVVPIENVGRRGDAIVIDAPLEAEKYVFLPGDDAKRGDTLARPGDVVTSGLAALLAAAGHAAIPVHRRPRVAIVCTGDEVVGVNELPELGEIRNSNAAMLAAGLARDGAQLMVNVHVGDSREALEATLRRAIAASDLVITTGGASVGERDFVKETLVTLGARFAFRSIALRPAKPTAFASCGKTLVAVLPGNPAAAFVAYAMLVSPVVRHLAGHANPLPVTIAATLDGSIRSKPQRHFVAFGRLTHAAGAFHVTVLGDQCSSLVRTSADANALIVMPPGDGQRTSGNQVNVEVLDWNAVRFER